MTTPDKIFEKQLLYRLLDDNKISKSFIEDYNSLFIPTQDSKNSALQQLLNNFKLNPQQEKGGYIILNKKILKNEPEVKIQFGQLPGEEEPTLRIEAPVFLNQQGLTSPLFVGKTKFIEKDYKRRIFVRVRIFENNILLADNWNYLVSLPIMVFSKLCNHFTLYEKDPKNYEHEIQKKGEELVNYENRGYFIINGIERFIISLENSLPNLFLVNITNLENKKDIKEVTIGYYSLAQSYSTYLSLKYSLIEKTFEVKTTYNVIQKIPLIILLKQLGLTDEDIVANIPHENSKIALQKAFMEYYRESKYLNDHGEINIEKYFYDKFRVSDATKIVNYYLDYSLLPHLGNSIEDRYTKALFLCFMIRYASEDVNALKAQDRDNMKNKHILTPSILILQLFDTYFRQNLVLMKQKAEKIYTAKNAKKLFLLRFKSQAFSNRIHLAFNIGAWPNDKLGVVQILDGHNKRIRISQLRRLNSDLDESLAFLDARERNIGSFGRTCSIDTPDGSNIGLLKSFAIGTKVTPFKYITNAHINAIKRLPGFINLTNKYSPEYYVLFINGVPTGYITGPISDFGKHLQNLRRSHKIPSEISISFNADLKKIEILSGAGRLARILISVQNGVTKFTPQILKNIQKYTFQELLNLGILEYIDRLEESSFEVQFGLFESVDFCPSCFIKRPSVSLYTQLIHQDKTSISVSCGGCSNQIKFKKIRTNETCFIEFHNLCSIGVLTATIPLLNHAPSHRILLGAGITRQAISKKQPFAQFRFETKSMHLVYPQQPLNSTIVVEKFDLGYAGQNRIIGIMRSASATLEDAIVINKHAVQRGFGRTAFFKSVRESCQEYNIEQKEKFEKLRETSPLKQKKKQLLENDGLPLPGTIFMEGDHIIIGKTGPVENKDFNNISREDLSIYKEFNSPYTTKKVILYQNSKRQTSVLVNFETFKNIEEGDKFAARYGQKGILSELRAQEDLPFSLDGVILELIFDPHGIPSRMAYLQLMELKYSKYAANHAQRLDLTRFTTPQKISQNDAEKLYNPRTGKFMKQDVAVGIIYYLRLHHLASEKIFSRARGPIQLFNKQPTEGKSKKGGLRFGEMERDCLIRYGASALLRDRFRDETDTANLKLCLDCQRPFFGNAKNKCLMCDSEQIGQIETTASFILLLKELLSIGIKINLETTNKNPEENAN
jgi:DNA-directed RNA polymerase subunit B